VIGDTCGPIPEPTPEEVERLRAEVRRIRAFGVVEPDDYDAMIAQLERLAVTGGAWPSTSASDREVAS
jgi:hypothetical protein